MSAAGLPPEDVRFEHVKRLDPSLSLKRNRPQIEKIVSELASVFKNNELVGGLVVEVPLADGRVHDLTVVANTREGLTEEQQEEYLFYSDYTALLLDVAKLFKATSKKENYVEYAPTEPQLKDWAHEAGAPSESISEFGVWEKRDKVATLLGKLQRSFSEGFEDDLEEDDEEKEGDEETKDDTSKGDKDEEQRKLVADALAKQAEAAALAAASSAVVPQTAEAPSVDTSVTPSVTTIDPRQPLSSQLTAKQMSQYNANIGWLTSFTLLHIADEMGLEISTLPPELRGELTGLVSTYLTTEGDLAELLKGSPTARLKAIRGLQKYLQQQNFYAKHDLYPSVITSLDDRTDQRINTILGDTNIVVDTNIKKTVEDIVQVHGQKSQKLIDSFDKNKVELIFGLSQYKITDTQADKLKGVLKSYAEVRLQELFLHTGDETTLEGLDPDQNPELKDTVALVEQISAVRATVQQHSKDEDEKGELVAGALTAKSGVTKKVKLAVEQNQKIFGAYWTSLSPEQQAVALASLDPSYKKLLKAKQHPVEGYPLPINIAEFDPAILRRFELEQSMIKNGKVPKEEFDIALEIAQYNYVVAREEKLAAVLRAEYIALTVQEQQAALATALAYQSAVEMQQQASFMEMYHQDEVMYSSSFDGDDGGEYGDDGGGGDTVGAAGGTTGGGRRGGIRGRLASLKNKAKKSKLLAPARKKIAALKKAASDKAHSTINKGIAKGAAMIPGVGTAAAAAFAGLSAAIGEKNANKLVAGAGVAAGLLFAKTLHALTTIGGAIGGAIGGIIGSFIGPGGILLGTVVGANVGAAIVPTSWLGLFGGGGGGNLFAAKVFPTIGSAATTATNAAGSLVSSTSTAASTAAQAVQASTATSTTAAQTAATIAKTAGLNVASAVTSLSFLAPLGGITMAGFFTLITLTVIFAAFLVPMPFTLTGGSSQTESLYATVEKTANPSVLENNTPTQVTYTIQIAPKTGYQIEIKSVTDTFSNIGGTTNTPTSPLTKENFPAGILSQPTTATYTIELSGEDTLVSNTVTFVLDVFDLSGGLVKQGESVSSIAAVSIGTPPVGCFEFAPAGESISYTAGGQTYTNVSQTITEADQNLFLQSFTRRVAANPTYASLLCSAGPILIHKWPPSPSGYYAWAFAANKIGFYAPAWSSGIWFEYTLIHETGHIIDARNGGLRSQFLQVKTDSSCYSFPAICSEGEAFAEGMVLYVLYQTLNFNFNSWTGPFPFKSDYPVEYNWYKQNIFGGQEF